MLAAIFHCLLLLLRLYYIDAWWKLVLSGLWGECYVCDLGEGCVDQVGIYDEPGASLATGCYLGTPGNGYLWWVNGI